MNTKALWIASGLVIAGLVASISGGCGDDDPGLDSPARPARKGEACRTTNDCTAGLACLPNAADNGGVCVVGVFDIAPTGKECAIIECKEARDCCLTSGPQCPALEQSCKNFDAGLGGSSGDCERYERECACDPSRRDCENGQCVVKCVGDTGCSSNGVAQHCLGGKCVQCANNDHCNPANQIFCLNGKCQLPCQGDGDCSGFDRCVQGKCLAGGCQTDRECVAATRNVEARCGTDGKCILPCQSDPECGNPKDYSFFSCIGGQCRYMGCESDKECNLLLGNTGTSGGLDEKQEVVCRPQALPNGTTKPAQ
ncbi:MAG: hypothetical protein K0S65_4123 [Labilithrix sp.]|nr:hypothetical protein [Labilithrix sp.]